MPDSVIVVIIDISILIIIVSLLIGPLSLL